MAGVRVVVSSELRQFQHAFFQGTERGMLVEEPLVLAEHKDSLDALKENKVDESDLGANQVVLGTEEIHDGAKFVI